MIDFIKINIIKKIEKDIKSKQESFTHNGFLFFKSPIVRNDLVIDRVNYTGAYELDEILPNKWFKLKGNILLEILKKLLDNEIYIFKQVNGKKYKIKMGRNDTFKQKH